MAFNRHLKFIVCSLEMLSGIALAVLVSWLDGKERDEGLEEPKERMAGYTDAYA